MAVQRLTIAVFLFCVLLSGILYGNTLRGEFVGDDFFFAERQELRQWSHLPLVFLEPLDISSPVPASYRPFAVLSFGLNFLLTGTSPVWFHVVNIVLNGIVAFLVYVWVFRLSGKKSVAFLTSTVFLLFPIHTEAVASIKSRDEILAALFALFALISADVFARSKRVRMWVVSTVFSAGCFGLAVLSKEFMIILPFILAGMVALRSSAKKGIITFLAQVPIMLIYLIVRRMVLGNEAFAPDVFFFVSNPLQSEGIIVRAWTAFHLLALYISKILFPFNLSAAYGYREIVPAKTLLNVGSIAGVGVATFLILLAKYGKTAVKAAVLLFLAGSFIYSSTVIVVSDIFAERWMYFPSIGIAMLLAYGILRLRSKKVIFVICAFIFVGYGSATVLRNRVWLTKKAFAESLVRDAPESVRARTVLARYYMGEGEFEFAREHIEAGMALYDSHPRLQELLSVLAFYDGNYGLAQSAALAAIDAIRPPAAPVSYLIYAMTLTKQGKYLESIALVRRVIDFAKNTPASPRIPSSGILDVSYTLDNPVIRFVIAVNYFKLGRLEEAERYMDWDTETMREEKVQLMKEF